MPEMSSQEMIPVIIIIIIAVIEKSLDSEKQPLSLEWGSHSQICGCGQVIEPVFFSAITCVLFKAPGTVLAGDSVVDMP